MNGISSFFVNQKPDPEGTALFDPTAFGCDITSEAQNGITSGMQIFLAIFITIIGIFVLSCFYYYCCRKRQASRQTIQHVELKEIHEGETEKLDTNTPATTVTHGQEY